MKKLLKLVSLLLVLAAGFYLGTVAMDKKILSDEVIRLHVVADSDSEADQAVKLKVRDAVLDYLDGVTEDTITKEQVATVLQEKLPELEAVANEVLEAEGLTDRATVTLQQEEFPTRQYETFTLPAGVYDSLRVIIGSGEGHNWWCVVFPSLCIPAAAQQVEDTAVGAGFTESLSGAITGEEEYEVRFFLLDCIGKLENFFFKG